MMRSRCGGKRVYTAAKVDEALSQGKRVVIATLDQKASIAEWQRFFPKALFTLVGDWGLRIHSPRVGRRRR